MLAIEPSAAAELMNTYGLGVVPIPTNRPLARIGLAVAVDVAKDGGATQVAVHGESGGTRHRVRCAGIASSASGDQQTGCNRGSAGGEMADERCHVFVSGLWVMKGHLAQKLSR